MRQIILKNLLTLLILFSVGTANAQPLVNPNATPQAKKLKTFLDSIYGKKIISGQAFEDVNETWNTRIYNESGGKLPAIMSLDFMNSSPLRVSMGSNPDATTDKAIDWVKNKGGLLEMHWHWDAPRLVTGDKWQAFYTKNTAFDIGAAMKDTTSEDYKLLIRDIDIISERLLRLQNEGIALLWRPVHEAEGKWFWWGAKTGDACTKLYRMMYNRMVNHHGINNLIWVWNSYGTTKENWYPGDDVVDIIAWDYPDYTQSSGSWSQYQKLFGNKGKLFALGEDGKLFNPDLLEKQPWLYFITWAYMIKDPSQNNGKNTAEWINQVYNDSRVLTLDDLQPGPKASAGQSQLLYDFDGDGKEPVTLDGSKSYTNTGNIISYSWKLNGNELATTVSPTIELPIGTHNLELTITTDLNESKNSKVVISIKTPSLTLNKPYQVSSTESGYGNVAALAIDGDLSSRWASRYSDPQWFQVDLGKRYDITKIVITWEVASAKSYRIEQSNDGENWVSVVSKSNMPKGQRTDIIDNLKGGAQFIRIYGTERNTTYGYSIFEFEAYGLENTAATPVAEVTTSIQKVSAKSWILYPNTLKTTDTLYITNNMNLMADQISIVDAKGATINTFKGKTSSLTIPMNEKYTTGNYLLRIVCNEETIIKKFAIK